MDLDTDHLIALCHAVDVAGDDPAAIAVMLELIGPADQDPGEVARHTTNFSKPDLDPERARQLAWLVESFRTRPELVGQVHEIELTRPTAAETERCMDELVVAIRSEPAAALALAVAETRRVDAGTSTWVTDFSPLVCALRRIDPTWLDTVIDLVPTEPGMWDAIWWELTRTNERRLVVDRLGVEALCRGWLARSNALPESDHTNIWAMQLVDQIEEWADEAVHRAVLLQLVESADDEQLWVVAAQPLEDFVNDSDDRLTWIEQNAVRNEKFRLALSGVWTTSKSAETAARIERAAGGESVPPDDEG